MNCVGLHYMYMISPPIPIKIHREIEIELTIIKQHQGEVPCDKKN